MKKIILILTIIALLTACKTQQSALDELRAEASWTAFCAYHGYDTTDSTYDVTNVYILTEKWAGLSFKNGPPERAYKVNKIMRRCHCSDLVFNHLLSLFEPV